MLQTNWLATVACRATGGRDCRAQDLDSGEPGASGSRYLAVQPGACTHGVEQRPVALLDLETLGVWRPDLQAQRSHDTIVSIVALQADPLEIAQRLAAIFAQPANGGLLPRRFEIGKYTVRQLAECSQHRQGMLCVTPEAPQDIGEDRIVQSTRHAVFGARRTHHLGKASQGTALIRCQIPDHFATP